MSADWDGFSFKDLGFGTKKSVLYAVFANVLLTNAHTVNTLLVVILCTGMCVAQYKEQLALLVIARISPQQALNWLGGKTHIKCRITKVVGRLGAGMYRGNVTQGQPNKCEAAYDNNVAAAVVHTR